MDPWHGLVTTASRAHVRPRPESGRRPSLPRQAVGQRSNAEDQLHIHSLCTRSGGRGKGQVMATLPPHGAHLTAQLRNELTLLCRATSTDSACGMVQAGGAGRVGGAGGGGQWAAAAAGSGMECSLAPIKLPLACVFCEPASSRVAKRGAAQQAALKTGAMQPPGNTQQRRRRLHPPVEQAAGGLGVEKAHGKPHHACQQALLPGGRQQRQGGGGVRGRRWHGWRDTLPCGHAQQPACTHATDACWHGQPTMQPPPAPHVQHARRIDRSKHQHDSFHELQARGGGSQLKGLHAAVGVFAAKQLAVPRANRHPQQAPQNQSTHLEEQGGKRQGEVYKHAAWVGRVWQGKEVTRRGGGYQLSCPHRRRPPALCSPRRMQPPPLGFCTGTSQPQHLAIPASCALALLQRLLQSRPRQLLTSRRSAPPPPALRRQPWPRSRPIATNFAPPARMGPQRHGALAGRSAQSQHACWLQGAAFRAWLVWPATHLQAALHERQREHQRWDPIVGAPRPAGQASQWQRAPSSCCAEAPST